MSVNDHELFTKFTSDPKGSSMETILGAHRFLATIIREEDDGPTLKILMQNFRPFVHANSIKDYVFRGGPLGVVGGAHVYPENPHF